MSKKQLLETIRAALDCGSHFEKSTIINNDPDFSVGDDAIVICGQCVKRMREALGLVDGETIPQFYEMKERSRQ